MDSKGKKGAAPLQPRVSSFGTNVKMGVKGKTVMEKKGAVASTSVKSSAAAVPEAVKITSKCGFDREVERKFDMMIDGDLKDLPHLPRSIVRIFLSSTFSDMRAERNMLARQVYPELRRHCAQFDLDFQVVDLRWGLTSETENDHSGTTVCLQEIKTCQDVSLGPNFVGIMGHRYGMHRPLVVEIPLAEFEILMEEAKSLSLPDIPLVQKWYQKDDNALPPVYVLQPIRACYPHYGNTTPGKEEQRQQDLEQWNDVDKRLRSLLQAAAKSAYKAKKISEMSWRQHFMSVTDHEVMNGVVQASSPDKHTVFFVRDLAGLTQEALSQKMAEKYIDTVNKDGKLQTDKETGTLITDLIGKVKGKLANTSMVSLSTQWQEGGIDPEKFPKHQQYISQLCSHFLCKVTSLINQGLDQRQAKIRQREWYTLYNEVLHHLRFCNSKCESFCGQDEVLMKAKKYILDGSIRTPLVIHAPSGAGKTSVMAMVMKSLEGWLPGGHVGIIRFLGTSPQSINARNVLFNMCGQLADSTGILMERLNYTSWKGLKGYTPRLLRRISSKLKKPAIILLDSLDQLGPENDSYSMDWLPTKLPQNIKLIVSTLPEEHGILNKLKQMLPDPSCHCAVPLLPQATGQQIVEKYLKIRNRKITEEQLNVILKSFTASPSPLYLKLLMDEAVKYPSFLSPNPASVPGSICLAINALYDNLEAKFGRRLIQSALGLLTVGLNGLSDVELEDALSCCDQVLDEVYKYHDPPVPGIVRIPPVLWARIRYDLREYLVERLSQGKTTLYWYHRQFIETATERYASGKDGTALHAILYHMFHAEDGVKKSITLSNRRNMFVKDADRQTTPQPMNVNNTRKLECVTYHMLHMKDLLSTDMAKASVFMNFSFLSTKLMSLGVDRVLGDLDDFLAIHTDEELLVLKHFMESQRSSLLSPRALAFRLIACLSVAPSFRHLKDLQNQAEVFLMNSDKAQLIPCLPCLAPRLGDPSFLLSGFARVVDQCGDCLLLEKESVDEDASSFAIVNIGTSDVTDVLLESNVSAIKLVAGGQGYAWISAENLKCKKNTSGKELSKSIASFFKESKVVPKTTGNMKISVSSDGGKDTIGLFLGNQAAVVSGDLGGQKLVSFGNASNYAIQFLIPCCMDSGNVVGSGDISESEHQSFMALWKSGAGKPSVIELKGSLCHSLVSLTSEEQFVVGVLQSSSESFCLVILQMQPFEAMSSVACGQVSQLRVSSTEQVVAILSGETDIQFVDVTQSAKLETISHKTPVSDFDVAWEEDRVVLSEPDGHIAIYSRSGKLLVTYLGHSQGISYLRYIGETITVLTCSGLVKVWDAASVSAMATSSDSLSSSGPGDGKVAGVTDSLNSLTNVINVSLHQNGEELITFATDGSVTVWNKDSLKKMRSFSVGITAHDVCSLAFSLCVAFDKELKVLKVIQLDSGTTLCGDIIPQNVICFTATSNRQSILMLSEQPHLVLNKVDVDGKSGLVSKSLTIQLNFGYVSIDLMLSTSERYLVMQVKISEKDYNAVAASWKKGNNLATQRHSNRFAAVDLNGSSGLALNCFRPLTKVPFLGLSLYPHGGNTMLVGTRRCIVFWDIPTGKCDGRMSKSSKGKSMFYRPEWVKAAFGGNISMALSPGGHLMAVGSEDGYMFVYEYESGLAVGMKAPATKHQAPVSHVCFTPDKSTVLSVCHNGVLKMWTANTATQVASMSLGSRVRYMQVTQDGQYVVAVSEAERSRVAVFKLHKGKV